MTKDRKIVIGVLIVTAILAFLFVRSLLKRDKAPKTHEDVIAAKDESIKAWQSTAEAWQEVAAGKQEVISQLNIKDSVLTSHYLINQKTYTRIDEKLKNIPVYIDRIAGNDDSIRAAFARD